MPRLHITKEKKLYCMYIAVLFDSRCIKMLSAQD